MGLSMRQRWGVKRRIWSFRKLRGGAEDSQTTSAVAVDGASLTSQSYGCGLLESCPEFCQAESIPVLQLQPDSSLGFGYPASNPAEKGQL